MRNKRPLLWIAILIMTACRQEISADAQIPMVTSAYATNTPAQTPLAPGTATPAFLPPQPLLSGPIHLITLGDDLTRGDGDDTGRGYAGRLLQLVSQIRPGSSITNFAQTGWTSDNLLRGDGEFSGQLERAVDEIESASSQGRAAVVLVWIGSNDLWELYSGGGEVTPLTEEADALRFSENIEAVLSALRKAGAEVIIARLDDQSQRPARTRSETYPGITGDELDRMAQQVRRYNEIISKKAARYGALVVDFYNTDLFTKSATLSSNGMHPNAAGYDLVSQIWYKSLIAILP